MAAKMPTTYPYDDCSECVAYINVANPHNSEIIIEPIYRMHFVIASNRNKRYIASVLLKYYINYARQMKKGILPLTSPETRFRRNNLVVNTAEEQKLSPEIPMDIKA
ncbi:6939_t:CDS:1 [Dentiscutata erythropus]|uniref:6939_t:CDS:1 n=1 Tax=Dentiscutata erythropus TaxID=1348616 RepID=A0A9N9DYA5_9GLOM|nr:6939_t:CDS:1 [Dentiscutata erythropus]